jgi:hypothetical protein
VKLFLPPRGPLGLANLSNAIILAAVLPSSLTSALVPGSFGPSGIPFLFPNPMACVLSTRSVSRETRSCARGPVTQDFQDQTMEVARRDAGNPASVPQRARSQRMQLLPGLEGQSLQLSEF